MGLPSSPIPTVKTRGPKNFLGQHGGSVYIWTIMIVVKYIGAAFLAWIVALIIRGFYTSHEVRLQVYLKPLTHSYFRLGLSFMKEVWMDKNVEVLTLGMFFIVLEIHFIEESDNKDLLIKEFLADVDVTTQSDDSSVQP